ncbi:hypothetical protein PYCC9005_005683 [Savitreella phatthalungensis]
MSQQDRPLRAPSKRWVANRPTYDYDDWSDDETDGLSTGAPAKFADAEDLRSQFEEARRLQNERHPALRPPQRPSTQDGRAKAPWEDDDEQKAAASTPFKPPATAQSVGSVTGIRGAPPNPPIVARLRTPSPSRPCPLSSAQTEPRVNAPEDMSRSSLPYDGQTFQQPATSAQTSSTNHTLTSPQVPRYPHDFQLSARALTDGMLDTARSIPVTETRRNSIGTADAVDEVEKASPVTSEDVVAAASGTTLRTPSIMLTANNWAEKKRLLKEHLGINHGPDTLTTSTSTSPPPVPKIPQISSADSPAKTSYHEDGDWFSHPQIMRTAASVEAPVYEAPELLKTLHEEDEEEVTVPALNQPASEMPGALAPLPVKDEFAAIRSPTPEMSAGTARTPALRRLITDTSAHSGEPEYSPSMYSAAFVNSAGESKEQSVRETSPSTPTDPELPTPLHSTGMSPDDGSRISMASTLRQTPQKVLNTSRFSEASTVPQTPVSQHVSREIDMTDATEEHNTPVSMSGLDGITHINDADEYHFDMRDSFNPAILVDRYHMAESDAGSLRTRENSQALVAEIEEAVLEPGPSSHSQPVERSATESPASEDLDPRQSASEQMLEEMMRELAADTPTADAATERFDAATKEVSVEDKRASARSLTSVLDKALPQNPRRHGVVDLRSPSLEEHSRASSDPLRAEGASIRSIGTRSEGIEDVTERSLSLRDPSEAAHDLEFDNALTGRRKRSDSAGSRFLEMMDANSLRNTQLAIGSAVRSPEASNHATPDVAPIDRRVLDLKDVKNLITASQRIDEYRRRTRLIEVQASGLREYLYRARQLRDQRGERMPVAAPASAGAGEPTKTTLADRLIPSNISHSTQRTVDRSKDAAKGLFRKGKHLFGHNGPSSANSTGGRSVSAAFSNMRPSSSKIRIVSGPAGYRASQPAIPSSPGVDPALENRRTSLASSTAPPSYTASPPQTSRATGLISSLRESDLPALPPGDPLHGTKPSSIALSLDSMDSERLDVVPPSRLASSEAPPDGVTRIRVFMPHLPEHVIEHALRQNDGDDARALGWLMMHHS